MSKEIFNVKFNGVSRSSKHAGLKDEHLNQVKLPLSAMSYGKLPTIESPDRLRKHVIMWFSTEI